MPSLRIKTFGGIKPKDERSVGDSSRASIAKNVNLERGMLQPWRYPAYTFDSGKSCLCSVKALNCCLVGSEKECVHFATIETCKDRVFSMGHKDWPAYAVLPDCCDSCSLAELSWKRLGVPTPEYPPTILSSDEVDAAGNICCDGGRTATAEPRTYGYTYVNEFGEESNITVATEVIMTEYDGCATVEFDIDDIPEGYEISTIRLYRGVPLSQAALAQGEVQNLDSSAEFFFVTEIDFQEGVFTYEDCMSPSMLGEAYVNDCMDPPLKCLRGVEKTNYGQLVAFEGKNLWFSRPWHPHVWDCQVNLDHCIVSIDVVGNSLYVTTNANPYVVDIGPQQGSDCTCCPNVREHPISMPNLSARSTAKMANGIMWATDTGLVKLQGDSLTSVTRKFITKDQWRAWLPHRIWGVIHQGKYFGFNDHKGFIFDYNEGVYGVDYPGEAGNFSELTLTPDSAFINEQDKLHLTFNGKVHLWDESTELLPYHWRTKLHLEGGLVSYAAMKVVFDDDLYGKVPHAATIRLYTDGRLIYSRSINCSQPFRLPKIRPSLNWEVEIEGIEDIGEVHLASSMAELSLLNNV